MSVFQNQLLLYSCAAVTKQERTVAAKFTLKTTEICIFLKKSGRKGSGIASCCKEISMDAAIQDSIYFIVVIQVYNENEDSMIKRE